MTKDGATARRRLDRPFELVDLDKTKDAPWWRITGGHHYRLEQDGREHAAVSTELQNDMSFGGGVVRCRRTEVRFTNGDRWVIRTHAPSRPRPEKRRPGIRYRGAWTARDRVISVLGRGSQNGRLAHLTGDPGTNPVVVQTADGRSLALDHSRRKLSDSLKQASGPTLTITRAKGRYVFTPTGRVALEAALLHWHLMLGDFQVPSSGVG